MSHPALTHLPKGWFHHGERLLELIEQHQPKVCVELGSYLGASAIATLRVLEPWGGVLYCVDTWSGTLKVGKRQGPKRIYDIAHNVIATKVDARVRLIPALTTEVAKYWNGPPIDYLYVDADHSEGGCYADLVAWWPHVRSGGLIAGDDYGHPKYPGVKIAWDAFESTHELVLTRELKADTNPPNMSLVYGWKP